MAGGTALLHPCVLRHRRWWLEWLTTSTYKIRVYIVDFRPEEGASGLLVRLAWACIHFGPDRLVCVSMLCNGLLYSSALAEPKHQVLLHAGTSLLHRRDVARSPLYCSRINRVQT